MVRGLSIFRKHFAGYEDSFVIIGGVACDEWFTRVRRRFRATRDIDMVLILDGDQPRFFKHFWAFAKEAGYEVRQRADGKKTLYGFENPRNLNFPQVIELFSNAPMEIEPFPGQRIVPIPAGEDVSSLSAILMDEEYYQFLMGQRELVDGLPLIRPAGLIVLKAKAWMDLSMRRTAGDKSVDEDDVKKHRSDVFRLASILPVGESISLPPSMAADLGGFLSVFSTASPEWRSILDSIKSSGNRMSPADLLLVLRNYFGMREGTR